MKKPQIRDEYDWYDEHTGRDYKLEQQIHNIRQNFESTTNWLYLGTDFQDPGFVKIGITTNDLSSRSSSSARPSYYLFCAFKFQYNISKQEMERIEEDVLSRMEGIYCTWPHYAKRLNHYESGRISECFQHVDFLRFFKDFHFEIYENHRNSFVICGYEDYGEFVDCIFNDRNDVSDQEYIEMIVQAF